ncbi:MAG: hypothetical protein ACE5DL_02595 [Nitrosopumilaceae archaeon]
MAISKENKEFIDSLIDYYISESQSYRQIAENYVPEVTSVSDTAFGIIAGCVYAGFLQAYQNQQQSPSLEDMNEFNQILKERAPLIKKSLIDESKTNLEEDDKTPSKIESDSKNFDSFSKNSTENLTD